MKLKKYISPMMTVTLMEPEGFIAGSNDTPENQMQMTDTVTDDFEGASVGAGLWDTDWSE